MNNNEQYKRQLINRVFIFARKTIALAKDLDSKFVEEINLLLKETDELVRILGSSISKLKGKSKL